MCLHACTNDNQPPLAVVVDTGCQPGASCARGIADESDDESTFSDDLGDSGNQLSSEIKA
jgi:hypothetical protein